MTTEDAAESLSLLLQLEGHDVRGGAPRPERRSTLAQRHPGPDTHAVLDIGMPDLSGYEVARSLRREPWASTLGS